MDIDYVRIMSSNFGIAPGSTTVSYVSGKIILPGCSEGFLSIEQIGAASNQTVQKDVGNTIARGILGGALLGPLGAIGGLMLGKNKVEGHDEYLFKVNLTNGKFFIFSSYRPVTEFHSLSPISEIQPGYMGIGTAPTSSWASIEDQRNGADINLSYAEQIQKINNILNRGSEHSQAYIEFLVFNNTSEIRKAYAELINGFCTGLFYGIFPVYVSNYFQEKIKDINAADKYATKLFDSELIPLFKKDKKKAFLLLNELKIGSPFLYETSLRLNNEYKDFIAEYQFSTDVEYAKKVFETKKKHVKKFVVNKNLAIHLYCLAQIYATGESAAFTDTSNYLKSETGTYPVCEKNEELAKELVEKSIAVARDNMSGAAKEELLVKCNQLKALLELPIDSNSEIETSDSDVNNSYIDESSAIQKQLPDIRAHIYIADELKKFAELRDAGVLTEEEFQSQKRKLLNT